LDLRPGAPDRSVGGAVASGAVDPEHPVVRCLFRGMSSSRDRRTTVVAHHDSGCRDASAQSLPQSAHRVGVPVADRLQLGSARMQHFRLTHPALTFYVDVTVHERDGCYMATADLAEDSRDVGVGDTPQETVRAALRSLGEPYASEMAEGVRL
jgi:hypothetical protein